MIRLNHNLRLPQSQPINIPNKQKPTPIQTPLNTPTDPIETPDEVPQTPITPRAPKPRGRPKKINASNISTSSTDTQTGQSFEPTQPDT